MRLGPTPLLTKSALVNPVKPVPGFFSTEQLTLCQENWFQSSENVLLEERAGYDGCLGAGIFINKIKPTKTLTWSLCAADVFCHWTHLPGQAICPVPVHLPLTNSSDQQTLPPPQLLALFDDVAPQLAGAQGAAQTLSVQLAKDPHAHLYRQRFCKVVRRAVRDGGLSFAKEKHWWGCCGYVMLHSSTVGLKESDRKERGKKHLVKIQWIVQASHTNCFDLIWFFLNKWKRRFKRQSSFELFQHGLGLLKL